MEKAQKGLYRNIIGDTKDTIDAIQRFLKKHSAVQSNSEIEEKELNPAGSVNKIVNSIADEEVLKDINKIIQNL